MKLKDNLLQLLRDSDWTAAQLSRKSGVSKQVLSQWLNGASPKNIDQIKAVASAFNTTVDRLCFGPTESSSSTIIEQHLGEIHAGKFEVILRKLKE